VRVALAGPSNTPLLLGSYNRKYAEHINITNINTSLAAELLKFGQCLPLFDEHEEQRKILFRVHTASSGISCFISCESYQRQSGVTDVDEAAICNCAKEFLILHFCKLESILCNWHSSPMLTAY